MSRYKCRHDVASVMEKEGYEYFVAGYASADQMPDKETEACFEKAESLYNEFQEAVGDLKELVGLRRFI